MIKILIFLISSLLINCQQLQWTLLSDGTGLEGSAPSPRRDAAIGFDRTYLILYGGRDQSGTPLQDSFAFNIQFGTWEPLNFPNPPPARYGMAAASSIGTGLYLFGGFGMQGMSQNYNPYMAYGSSGLPGYRQNPIGTGKQNLEGRSKQKREVTGKQYYNLPNPGRYSGYSDDDDRADENYYPLQDAWFLNYMTKSWQQVQTTQYARGFGSAAASSYVSGMPRIVYSMGKSRDWLYSTVETTSQVSSGFNPMGAGQSAIIMYDLSSYSPAYPHARYGHSTALLTDNELLLYGGCLSGYGKGGPCPSTDTWLLHIDRGHWERLWECPTTKTGAAMVALPSASTCAAMGQGIFGPNSNFPMGNDQPVAVLWGGREHNPSSIRTYLSPQDEVAVFSLSQKRWYLKRARASLTGGSYPIQREGAAYVAGCFQGAPGMFVFGGRSVTDRRLLSDLWFLQASPQDALTSPGTRSCIYPFSYYHLHGIFQFFAYGVVFPIGYLVGRHFRKSTAGRPVHMVLQIFGVALTICGFAFGVHSVRAPAWLHFKHPHAVIGIITFILTIIQFFTGLVGAFLIKKPASKKGERFSESHRKIETLDQNHDKWGGTGVWRTIHLILGVLVLLLGFVNISLGVFLGVLPLAVWIIWYIYFGFLLLILIGAEIIQCLRHGKSIGGKGTHFISETREGPKGTSQSSLKDPEDPTEQDRPAAKPLPRRPTRGPPHESTLNDYSYRPGRENMNDDMAPLVSSQRQPRSDDVSSSARLPDYERHNERGYPVPIRQRSGLADSAGFDYYTGYSPEHEQPTPRSTLQRQNEPNLTRVRLQ